MYCAFYSNAIPTMPPTIATECFLKWKYSRLDGYLPELEPEISIYLIKKRVIY
jgi:hypothetical protein